MEPATIWQPTSGNGEMGQQGTFDLITLSGNFLVTLLGSKIILDTSIYSIIPATTWIEDNGI